MKLLVTGASGLLGTALQKSAAGSHEVDARSHRELDVTDRDRVKCAVRESAADAVLHCAAYTDVDGAEHNPELAMKVNAEAARFVAEAARERRATMVYVSTDYVFDGESSVPYDETSPVNPLSIYGESKLQGERQVAAVCPEDFLTVRTGWLYGSGKGFVDWVRQGLAEGRELPLIEDLRGSPTYVFELAEAILRLVEEGHKGVVHFVNRGVTSWLDFGHAIAEELAVESPRLRPVSAESLGRPAPRPAYSALAVDKYEQATGEKVPLWREALRRYLAEYR